MAQTKNEQHILDGEVLRSRDSLEMMRRPRLWPNWPVLPLKRRSESSLETGFLYEVGIADKIEDADIRFVKGNIYMFSAEQVKQAPKADLRQLVNDGWMVD